MHQAGASSASPSSSHAVTIAQINAAVGSPGLLFLDEELLAQRVDRSWSREPSVHLERQSEVRIWRLRDRRYDAWPADMHLTRATFFAKPGVAGVLYVPTDNKSVPAIRVYQNGAFTPVNKALGAGIERWGSPDSWLFHDDATTAFVLNRSSFTRQRLDLQSGENVYPDEALVYDLSTKFIVSLGEGKYLYETGGWVTLVERGKGRTAHRALSDRCIVLAQASEPRQYWVGHERGRIALYQWGEAPPLRAIETGARVTSISASHERVAAVIGKDWSSMVVVYGNDDKETTRLTAPWAGVRRDRNGDAEIALSGDGRLVALQHPEHGDLVVWEVDSGKVVISAAGDGTVR
jgi:hypothetical protein